MTPGKALALARNFSQIYGVVGKKIIAYDLKKDQPSDDDLKKILIGRSGTLRAPCLQVNDVFVAGFEGDLYRKLLRIK